MSAPVATVRERSEFRGLRLTRWAALWQTDSSLGASRHLLFEDQATGPALFRTRREARAWIEAKFGYIRKRPDLQAEPHRWRVPRAIKVYVRFAAAAPREARP